MKADELLEAKVKDIPLEERTFQVSETVPSLKYKHGNPLLKLVDSDDKSEGSAVIRKKLGIERPKVISSYTAPTEKLLDNLWSIERYGTRREFRAKLNRLKVGEEFENHLSNGTVYWTVIVKRVS